MAAHAKHSLSGSKRRYACPGSPTMEAPFPDSSTKSAANGTAMHLVAAWCLTEHRRADLRIAEMINVTDEDEPPEYVEFSDDMAELTQGYVDTVRALGIENLMLIEQRVDVSEITGVADQFGTADCIIFDRRAGELMVIDLKTGYRPVSPVDNTQLQLYALGALKLLLDGNLLAQRQAAGQAAQANAPGVAPAVPAHADADGQPDPGVVGGGELAPGEAGQTQEVEDELW
jgi:hypothetical protein